MFNNFVLGATGDEINSALQRVVDIVTLIGGTAFTLAIMIIGLVIIFGSVSAAKMRGLWIALISCIAGAFIFFSANWLSGAIDGIAMFAHFL
ncbi:TrbC/VirB2 family protein (plasmid) [Rossellomorea sp. AcN35-11]|nr:TrbC/VirB2 family protein [Rossellomorea aquimaris]WJV32396.1 TrbC/VirB2 family protein [Rossellomorea sp. AcN35-11]